MYTDRVVIPRVTEAQVRLVENKKGGHADGKPEVQLEPTGLIMNGQELEVVSDAYQKDQEVIAAKVKGRCTRQGAHSGGHRPRFSRESGNCHISSGEAGPSPRKPGKFRLTVPLTLVTPPADTEK